jgi:hypothetical protein
MDGDVDKTSEKGIAVAVKVKRKTEDIAGRSMFMIERLVIQLDL